MSKARISGVQAENVVSFYGASSAVQEISPAVLPDVRQLKKDFVDAGGRIESRREQIHRQAKEQGHAEGFEIGYREGREIGVAEAYRSTHEERHTLIESQITEYGQFLERQGDLMRKAMDEWFGNAERELGNIAVVIAERIIRRELELAPETVLTMAREAIAEVNHSSRVRILVNPQDRPFLEGYQDKLKQVSSSVESIELVDDPNISSGVMIVTEGGNIDVRVETHLRNLLERILGEAA